MQILFTVTDLVFFQGKKRYTYIPPVNSMSFSPEFILKLSLQDTLKAFVDSKNMQQKCMK